MCLRKSRSGLVLFLALAVFSLASLPSFAQSVPIAQMSQVQLLDRLAAINSQLATINSQQSQQIKQQDQQLQALKEKLTQALDLITTSQAETQAAQASLTSLGKSLTSYVNAQEARIRKAEISTDVWRTLLLASVGGFGGYLADGWTGAAVGAGIGAAGGITLIIIQW